MTGEDMIIRASAELLHALSRGEPVPEIALAIRRLKRCFWVAGRCETCGGVVEYGSVPRCGSCRIVAVNRSQSDDE